jgi:hypothetical protein
MVIRVSEKHLASIFGVGAGDTFLRNETTYRLENLKSHTVNPFSYKIREIAQK